MTDSREFHEGDMAYELAEYEFHHAPLQEILDKYTDQWEDADPIDKALLKARHNCHKHWQELATREPDHIRRLYDDVRGVPQT